MDLFLFAGRETKQSDRRLGSTNNTLFGEPERKKLSVWRSRCQIQKLIVLGGIIQTRNNIASGGNQSSIFRRSFLDYGTQMGHIVVHRLWRRSLVITFGENKTKLLLKMLFSQIREARQVRIDHLIYFTWNENHNCTLNLESTKATCSHLFVFCFKQEWSAKERTDKKVQRKLSDFVP